MIEPSNFWRRIAVLLISYNNLKSQQKGLRCRSATNASLEVLDRKDALGITLEVSLLRLNRGTSLSTCFPRCFQECESIALCVDFALIIELYGAQLWTCSPATVCCTSPNLHEITGFRSSTPSAAHQTPTTRMDMTQVLLLLLSLLCRWRWRPICFLCIARSPLPRWRAPRALG